MECWLRNIVCTEEVIRCCVMEMGSLGQRDEWMGRDMNDERRISQLKLNGYIAKRGYKFIFHTRI